MARKYLKLIALYGCVAVAYSTWAIAQRLPKSLREKIR
jgi:hypothetical protein